MDPYTPHTAQTDDYNARLRQLMDAVRAFADKHGGWLGNERGNVTMMILRGALTGPGSVTVRFGLIEPGYSGQLEITDHTGFRYVFDHPSLPTPAALIGLIDGRLRDRRTALRSDVGPGEFFQVTAPPFDVFPDEAPEVVQHAYERLFTQRTIDALIAAEIDADKAAVAVSSTVLLWMTASHISWLIALHVGRAPDGLWELPRVAFPPDEEVSQAAAKFGGDPTGTVTLREAQVAANRTLNDVCLGRRPDPLPALDPEPIGWVLAALLTVLTVLQTHGVNMLLSTSAAPPDYDHAPDGEQP